MQQQNELLIKIILDSWYSTIDRVNKFLDAISDDQLLNEVSPGRNRGIYLLGHLTAVHDRMFVNMGIGQQLHPELNDTFLAKPDRTVAETPSTGDLRAYWKEVNDELAKHFAVLKAEDWFQKHTSVSEEDFANEPHRNRVNIVVSRTNHLSYHFGQMAFLKK